MAVNKVVYNTENGAETLIDLTSDSVTPETLAKGTTAHDASGNVITGTMRKVDELLENITVNDTLFWDGNIEGKAVFDMIGDGSYTYYPVSENVLSLDDLANGVILESSDMNGNAFEEMKLTDFAMMTNKIIASRSVSSVLFVLEDNAPLYASTIPKKGIYFLHSEEFGYVSRIQIEGYTNFNSEKEVLKKNYLPDHTHGWDDLTDDCKTEINDYIVDELAKHGQLKPEFANNIDECEDITKLYVLPDGYIYAYMYVEGSNEQSYTNQLESVGSTPNTYLSSSNGNTSTKSGYSSTGFISIDIGSADRARGEQVIRLENISALPTDSYVRMGFYDANKTFLAMVNATAMVADTNDTGTAANIYKLDENGYINYIDVSGYTHYLANNGGKGTSAYFRICAPAWGDDAIITVNEEIAENTTTGGYQWLNTRHAFVPADYENQILILETRIEGHEGRLSEIEEAITDSIAKTDGVPDYIVEEAKRVANAVQSVRTAKTLVFPVMTDFHLYYNNSSHNNSLISAQYAGMGIRELQKRLHMDFVALLGDYTCGANTYTIEQLKNDIVSVKESMDKATHSASVVWCVGNHDLNYGSGRDRLMTADELYSYIGANSDGIKPYSEIDRCYGYIDFENQKVRVIYLNTCDIKDRTVVDGEEAPAAWISPTQIQWLADVALDVSDKEDPFEWGIIFVSHHPINYGGSCFTNLMQLLEAYREGINGQMDVTSDVQEIFGSVAYPQEKVTYNFADMPDRAAILCNIHGHSHNCHYKKVSSSTSVTPWLWRFCVPNISANRYNEAATSSSTDHAMAYGEFSENGEPAYWYKETGTANATSFNVVSVDRKNRKIYLHIFGAGTDREVSY